MKSILGHIGAWAPKPEQVAVAHFLENKEQVDAYLKDFKSALHERLIGFYNGIKALKKSGLAVDAIVPQAAIYLTVKIDILDRSTGDGHKLETLQDITSYILDEAGLAWCLLVHLAPQRRNPGTGSA